MRAMVYRGPHRVAAAVLAVARLVRRRTVRG